MYTNSLTISTKGQITLPKKIRDILSTNTIKLEVTDDNKIMLLPVKNVAGRLSAYEKESGLSFEEVRTQAWKETILNKPTHNDE